LTSSGLKLTTYFGERHRSGSALVADQLLNLYERHQVQLSVLLRGVEGFGLKHHLRTDRLLTLSEDLPLVSVALDEEARIRVLLDEVLALERHGLVTLERARLLTAPGDEAFASGDGLVKLTVYVGRKERIDGQPAFLRICNLLHARGVAGTTVLLGVDGTVHGTRQRARFFGRNPDVPLMIIAVGAAADLALAIEEVRTRLRAPVATVERVQVCKRDGQLLTRPPEAPGTDPSGLPLWQKLMVYTSSQAEHDGSPIHVALVRALRRTRARGATSVRGVWGFHGNHPPHGDRLLQLRRRVPVVTIVIDAPERIQDAFEIVNGLTHNTGLVTSELVPAAITASELAEFRIGHPDAE
jgi:PII-like signaling protein